MLCKSRLLSACWAEGSVPFSCYRAGCRADKAQPCPRVAGVTPMQLSYHRGIVCERKAMQTR